MALRRPQISDPDFRRVGIAALIATALIGVASAIEITGGGVTRIFRAPEEQGIGTRCAAGSEAACRELCVRLSRVADFKCVRPAISKGGGPGGGGGPPPGPPGGGPPPAPPRPPKPPEPPSVFDRVCRIDPILGRVCRWVRDLTSVQRGL